MAIFILGPDPNGTCCDCNGRTSPCDTCGSPSDCKCNLFLPGLYYGGGYYVNYATALNVLTNGKILDCFIAYNGNSSGSSFESHIPNYVTAYVTPEVSGGIWSMAAAVSVTSSSTTITVQLVSAPSTATQNITIYDCSGNIIIDDTTVTDSPQNFTVPSAGAYIIYARCSGTGINPTSVLVVGDASGGTIKAVNPIIAEYDDSGTIRLLEKCPKMLLPPMTEASASWYASCADALAMLSDTTRVANCIAYTDIPWTTFSATDGGTSITFNQSAGVGMLANRFFCSLNCSAGATLTFTITGQVFLSYMIYDYNGTEIDAQTNVSSGASSISLPYNGRYIISFYASNSSSGPTSMSATINGCTSVNEIQALYDVGTTCPGRLNCGDSCP